MVTLRVLGQAVNVRSEPSASGGQTTVLETLAADTLVDQEGPAPGHPDWVKVHSPGETPGS